MTRRRRIAEYAWFFAVAAWAIFRITMVGTWLADYGVNTWVFAVVEICSSIPYGFGSACFIRALAARQTQKIATWGLITAASYVAPDVYLLTSGRSMPASTYVIIIAIVLCLAVISAGMLIREYRQLLFSRREANRHGGTHE